MSIPSIKPNGYIYNKMCDLDDLDKKLNTMSIYELKRTYENDDEIRSLNQRYSALNYSNIKFVLKIRIDKVEHWMIKEKREYKDLFDENGNPRLHDIGDLMKMF